MLTFHANKYRIRACTSPTLTFPLSITASRLTISAIRSSTRQSQSKTEYGITFISWAKKIEDCTQLPSHSKTGTTSWSSSHSATYRIRTATAPFTTSTTSKSQSKPSTFLIIIDIYSIIMIPQYFQDKI